MRKAMRGVPAATMRTRDARLFDSAHCRDPDRRVRPRAAPAFLAHPRVRDRDRGRTVRI